MKTIEELNELFKESEECDKGTFAEMRSNLLLIAGEHYTKKGMGDLFNRVRSARSLPTEAKVRLTRNHIQNIHKSYVNNILTYAPGVEIVPKNESEIQDRKAAELNNSVWQDAKHRHGIDEKILDWADDFCGCGEVYTKLYFDPNAGQLKGYAQAVGEDGGPAMDPQGNPMPDKQKPLYTGDVLFESVLASNLLRKKQSKTIKESPYLAIRKMTQVADLKKSFPEHAEKIKDGEDKTFLVFDDVNMSYRKASKDECMVKEFYFRPCAEYPMGYFYICSDEVILSEGELPVLNGKPLFPIEGELFDKTQTEARGHSIIKQLRPYQSEINRCGSKMAEHQMTLGDDKVFTLHGSKLSEGAFLPGIRHYSLTGGQPFVMEGRSGAQYLDYLNSIIDEMYRIAKVEEDSLPAENSNIDPYALLFRASSQKKHFKRYISKFEGFLSRTCKLYLEMCKLYMDEEMFVLVAGKKERVNIAEFKQTDDLGFTIKIMKVGDDLETMMGKQLTMSGLMQYAGSKMDREDIGKILKNMPYANVDESFSDLTLNYEIAQNLILALDRGEQPPMRENDPHEYIAQKLNHRMSCADYAFMHDFIKSNYEKSLQDHLAAAEEVRQKIARDNAGQIPTGGTLIGVDYFVQDKMNPGKTKRARIPYDAMDWLTKKLEEQGVSLAEINNMPPELQAQMPGPIDERKGPINGQ